MFFNYVKRPTKTSRYIQGFLNYLPNLRRHRRRRRLVFPPPPQLEGGGGRGSKGSRGSEGDLETP